jgi:hypothetical protein
MYEKKITYRSSWSDDINRKPLDDEGLEVYVRKVHEEHVDMAFGSERRAIWEDRAGRRYIERRYSSYEGHASSGSFLPA